MKDILSKLCREYVRAKNMYNEEFNYSDPVRSITLQLTRNQRAMQIADLIVASLDEIEIKPASSVQVESLETGS